MQSLTITIEDTTSLLGVGIAAVKRMIASGELKSVKTPCGKKIRVSLVSIWAVLGAPESAIVRAAANVRDRIHKGEL